MRSTFLFLLALGLGSSAYGQATSADTRPDTRVGTRVGLGIALGQGSFLNLAGNDDYNLRSPVLLSLPIHTPNVRIEPEIGYASFSSESSYSESGDEKMTISTLQIETGLAAQRREGDFALYGGARFGIVRLGFDRGDNDNSETGYYAGPVAGAEHFFSERFTLGVEGQLVYQALDAGNDVSAISTRGLLFGRFYF